MAEALWLISEVRIKAGCTQKQYIEAWEAELRYRYQT